MSRRPSAGGATLSSSLRSTGQKKRNSTGSLDSAAIPTRASVAPVPTISTSGVATGAGSLESPDVDAEILTQSAMHRATQERDLVQVKTLVEGKGGKDQDGGVLEDKDAFGLTPLLKACLCADLAVVSYLVESGADINARDGEGHSALHYAALNSTHPDIIGYLVKAVGLDVNSVDHAQRTPVYMAAANGKGEAVRELMALGADASLTDEKGQTPAAVVCERTNGTGNRDAILALLGVKEGEATLRPKAGPSHRATQSDALVAYAAPPPEKEKLGQEPPASLSTTQEAKHVPPPAKVVSGARASVSLGERVGLEDAHVAAAATLLSKLTNDAAALARARQGALDGLEHGHLHNFMSPEDDALLSVLRTLAQEGRPVEEAPLATLRQAEGHKARLDALLSQIKTLCGSVPEEHVEANSMLSAHPPLAAAVGQRDAVRDELCHTLRSLHQLGESPLPRMTHEAQELAAILTGALGTQQQGAGGGHVGYPEVVAACAACLDMVKGWEKQVRGVVEEAGSATSSATSRLASALVATVALLDPPPATSKAPPADDPPLLDSMQTFATQVSREWLLLGQLQRASAVHPPFPRDALREAGRQVLAYLTHHRLTSLAHVTSSLPYWQDTRSELEPWMGRSSASVSSAFVSENAKSRDTLLRLEDEIIDKTYERAKIHNAQRRKGASSARAREAVANLEALTELRAEKRQAASSRKELLLHWLGVKESVAPELPLPRAELLGHFHAAMQVSLSDPLARLFSPGRVFADYTLLHGRVPGMPKEVHRASYGEGSECALQVYAPLSQGLHAFLHDAHLRLQLQNTGVPIVPIEALFTEDEHQGTGYMQLPLYAHDLAAWTAASPRRTSTQLLNAVCNVLCSVSGLHAQRYVHGELRLESFVLDPSSELPLLAHLPCDAPPLPSPGLDSSATLGMSTSAIGASTGLGLSTSITTSASQGALQYMAPELKSGEEAEATFASDMFAVGVLIRRLRQLQPSEMGGVGDPLSTLASALCQEDAAARPSAVMALNMLRDLTGPPAKAQEQ